ncbi:MAG: branched-chain amino acid ABC transporter substrate-binding protein [Actinomycetota bacterium]|jgi:branched-chain amino acid transport system substrate-binding protein|nr:branched-chain amino acid ABC transporter substrate-binding protein [Actinomycetota bacterium]MDZ4180879.1 branched-chain amino acid ABC transporter substrate-binding protein [Coriobacteriia bacterium]
MIVGKSKKLLSLVTALLLVAMVATAGCGGGGETTDGDADAGGEVVTVKLGVGAPLTQGAVALGKGIERGATLAIEEFNASDEAKELGIKVEPFVVDDQGDPKVGVNVANQLTSDPDVIGVVGHLNSGVSIPNADVYGKAGIVQVSPASTNPALTLDQKFGNVFRVCTVDPVQGAFAADAAFNEFGYKTAFVVDDATPYGEGLAEEFAKNFEAAGGEVLGTEKTSDKDTDFNALVTKIKGENPDIIYYGGIYNAGALFAKQAAEGGFVGNFFSGDGIYSPDYIALAGAANAEGDLCTSIGLPLDQQAKGADFRAMFEAKYGDEDIQAYDTYAYDAALVVLEALKVVAADLGADQLTSADGKAAIVAAVAATNIEGISGNVSFDEFGDTLNKAVTLYIVKDGAWAPYE